MSWVVNVIIHLACEENGPRHVGSCPVAGGFPGGLRPGQAGLAGEEAVDDTTWVGLCFSWQNLQGASVHKALNSR